MNNIFDVDEVVAHSRGIIEVGTVIVYSNDDEYVFEVEEHIINGNHHFRVFYFDDNETMKFMINEKTGEVLDDNLIHFIHGEYQRLTAM